MKSKPLTPVEKYKWLWLRGLSYRAYKMGPTWTWARTHHFVDRAKVDFSSREDAIRDCLINAYRATDFDTMFNQKKGTK